jgi:Mn-dependent DtxR family transcriptional regulator
MPPSPYNYKASALYYLLSRGDDWVSSNEITKALSVRSQSMGSILATLEKNGMLSSKEARRPYSYFTGKGNPMKIMRKMRVYRLTAKGRKEAKKYD